MAMSMKTIQRSTQSNSTKETKVSTLEGIEKAKPLQGSPRCKPLELKGKRNFSASTITSNGGTE